MIGTDGQYNFSRYRAVEETENTETEDESMSLMTKKALAASLKKLTQDKPFDKITVKDVVEDCGVNRQTFYYHFQDIYDLLGWIYKTEAVGGISDYKTYETWQQGFLKIFQYVLDNRKLCLNTYHSLARDHLEDFLREVVHGLLRGVIDEVIERTEGGGKVSEKDKNFVADFYSFAFIGLLLNWLREGLKESPEAIVRDLSILVEGDIEKAVNKFVQER